MSATSSSIMQVTALGVIAATGLAMAQDGVDQAELMRRIEKLEKQNARLNSSYAQARKDAEDAKAKLAEIRMKLEALGGAALGNSEDRLLEAVSSLEIINRRVQKLEHATVKLSGAISAYMKQSISDDSESRLAVEASLRELDSVLGFRTQPARDGAGNLSEARILSIDSETGLLVLNVGRTAGMRVGMSLVINRGVQNIGEAIVTDVRKDVSGALVQKLQTPSDAVRVGDSAAVKTT